MFYFFQNNTELKVLLKNPFKNYINDSIQVFKFYFGWKVLRFQDHFRSRSDGKIIAYSFIRLNI
jgi:hypothetical protein